MKLRSHCLITSELRVDLQCSAAIPAGVINVLLEGLAKRLEAATPPATYGDADEVDLFSIADQMMGARK